MDEGNFKRTCKIRKWIPFAKCDACAQYREAKQATKCKDQLKVLLAAQRDHLERVRRERASYYLKQKLAIQSPERYLSVIIDGADSSPYMLPHLAYRSHASDASNKVKMHVLGCIAHGRDTYAFTCPPHIAQGHDPNPSLRPH